MLPIKLGDQRNEVKILCLGAHCDDIEIGCGGTLLRLYEEYRTLHVKWFVFTSTPERSAEAKESAATLLQKFARKEIRILEFEDGYLPYHAEHVKKKFEELKEFQPDIIFSHYRYDLHQDHRFICELTWNTFRNHLIFEYEIAKYDGDLGHPNFYVPLNQHHVDEKIKIVLGKFRSQAGKQWFDRETFSGLMRIRGLECASKTRYAEAFHVRKMKY